MRRYCWFATYSIDGRTERFCCSDQYWRNADRVQFQITTVDIPWENINILVRTGYLLSTCYMFLIDPSGRGSNGNSCGRPLAGVRGLIPAEGMDVFLLRMSRVTHVEASVTS